jgi:hypothetical protein
MSFTKGVVAGALIAAVSLAAGVAYAGNDLGALFTVRGTCANGIASVATTGAAKCVIPYTAFNTAGVHLYKVPVGATSLHVRMWGAGGGGGSTDGGGGEQGSSVEFYLPVKAGQTLTFSVGTGGAGGVAYPPGNGVVGFDTTATFKGKVMASAPGGAGGLSGAYCPSDPLAGSGAEPGSASAPGLGLSASAGLVGQNGIDEPSCPGANGPQTAGGGVGLPGAGGSGGGSNSDYEPGIAGSNGFVFVTFG